MPYMGEDQAKTRTMCMRKCCVLEASPQESPSAGWARQSYIFPMPILSQFLQEWLYCPLVFVETPTLLVSLPLLVFLGFMHNQGPDVWILMPSPSLQASDSWADIVPIIDWISHGIVLKGFHKCSYFWKCSDMSCLYPAKGWAYFFKSSNSQVEKINLTKVTKGRGVGWIYCISSRFTEPGPTHRLAELAFLQVPKLSLLDMKHDKQKEKSISFQLILICLGSVGSYHAVGICGPKQITH